MGKKNAICVKTGQYAPKDRQTKALCSDPQSVCSSEYGISLGRGSFKWANGAWTAVQQYVTLNTPGENDGGFRLFVNGKLVIERNDIYYRGVPSSITQPPTSQITEQIPSPTAPGMIGGSSVSLLYSVLHQASNSIGNQPDPRFRLVVGQSNSEWVFQIVPVTMTSAIPSLSSSGTPINGYTATHSTDGQPDSLPTEGQSSSLPAVGFTGLFFR